MLTYREVNNGFELKKMAEVKNNLQNENAEKILRMGIRLMANNGYQATSTRAIVEAAGVTKPMLYYYFGSKEGLCKAGIRRFSDQIIVVLREAIDRFDDPRESLIEYIWAIFKYMQDHHDEGLFYMSLFFGPERQWFLDDIKAVLADCQTSTIVFIEKLIGAGILRPGCEEDFNRTLRGMVDVWRWASIMEEVTLSRDIAEKLVDNLLNGFGVH
jgi:TetR/AcrR family transcriptional regulator